MKTRSFLFVLAKISVISTMIFSGWLYIFCQEVRPPIKKGIPKGSKIIDGDILVAEDFHPKVATAWKVSFWPNGVVPYFWGESVSEDEKPKMWAAMREWEHVANIDFQEYEGTPAVTDYFIRIESGDKNHSYVGRIYMAHELMIANWDDKYKICHELGHALGFYHEQSRADRDNYVTIVEENIQPGEFDPNFIIPDDVNSYGPYDFKSVMHYNQCEFNVCEPHWCMPCADGVYRPSIRVKPGYEQWQDTIGQRNYLSFWDKRVMSFLYSQSSWIFFDVAGGYKDTDFPEGSFLYPYTSFNQDMAATVPEGGVAWIQPGSYASAGVYSRAMRIIAPLGGVILR